MTVAGWAAHVKLMCRAPEGFGAVCTKSLVETHVSVLFAPVLDQGDQYRGPAVVDSETPCVLEHYQWVTLLDTDDQPKSRISHGM